MRRSDVTARAVLLMVAPQLAGTLPVPEGWSTWMCACSTRFVAPDPVAAHMWVVAHAKGNHGH